MRGNNNAYYASTFPGGQTAPAAQAQSGALAVGTIGFAWRDVIISKTGSTVEWFINGLKIAAITGASFTSSNIFLGYWDYFPSLSDNTNLSFGLFDNVRVERFVTNVPPYLTTQPQSLTVAQNSNAMFNVMAGGTRRHWYQWRFNGTNLAGATGSSFTKTNVQPADAGDYSVFVTNGAGLVTSSNASLTVVVPQTLKVESVTLLSADQLKLVISGEPGTITIQWSTNLTEWETLTNLANPTGLIEFIDTISAEAAQRYYRVGCPRNNRELWRIGPERSNGNPITRIHSSLLSLGERAVESPLSGGAGTTIRRVAQLSRFVSTVTHDCRFVEPSIT